jgi:hypothetical protein
MSDPGREVSRYYAALQDPPTAALEARVMEAVSAARPPVRSGRRLALVAATLAVAAALGWAVYPPPTKVVPRQDPVAKVQEPPPGEIAARINDEIVTWKDVEARLVGIKPSDVTEALRHSVLRQLAKNVLFRQFAERKGQTVTEQEVDDAARRDIESTGGQEAFERMIRLRYGTLAKYRQERKLEMLVFKGATYAFSAKAFDAEFKDLELATEVPEADLRKYYEANPHQFRAVEKISFMRVGVEFLNPGEKETKRAILESVLRKIEAGTEFAMAAFYYSNVGRARHFRDLGVSRKDLEAVYEPETIRYLFEVLKEGETSPILQDRRTLNIFRMEQKINQKEESFEEAREKIKNRVENQLREANRKKLRDFIRSRARIEPADLFEDK